MCATCILRRKKTNEADLQLLLSKLQFDKDTINKQENSLSKEMNRLSTERYSIEAKINSINNTLSTVRNYELQQMLFKIKADRLINGE